MGIWIALHQDEETLVGSAGFHGCPDSDGTVEIGYLTAPAHGGRGYATEAVRALVGWAFSRPEVMRVAAECARDNRASIRVLEKAVFGRTGLLRWETPAGMIARG